MKWKELKAELERQGIRDDDVVFYIDIYPNDGVHAKMGKAGWEVS